MANLKVRLCIDDLRSEDYGSVVRVAIRDTTLADALHPTVAEATSVLEPGRLEVEMVVKLPNAGLDPRHRYSLWAHVDHQGSGEIQSGDLITTQNVPLTPEDIDAGPVNVPLARI